MNEQTKGNLLCSVHAVVKPNIYIGMDRMMSIESMLSSAEHVAEKTEKWRG